MKINKEHWAEARAHKRKHTGLIGFLICAMVYLFVLPADAQQQNRIPRIAYLSRNFKPTATTPDLKAEAFLQKLRDLGYREGKNVQVEFYYAEGKGERFPSFLGELIERKVDVLVSGTIQAIRAAKQATKTIPIVIVTQADPTASGLVKSLARPGENITGVTRFTRELNGKRLEVLKEAIPKASQVIFLADAGAQMAADTLREYEAFARGLNLQFRSIELRNVNHDLDATFEAAVRAHADALLTITSPILDRSIKQIASLAIKHRLPSMNEESHWVEAGGLLSYAANDTENFRRAAVYVDKILKGAKPADLPIEQPTKFELVINLKTAKQIGIAIPPNVLARADKVIR